MGCSNSKPLHIYLYIVIPYVSDNIEDIHVDSQDQSVMELQETVNVTWSPNDLTEGLLLEEDTTVDITMVSTSCLVMIITLINIYRTCMILILTLGRAV